MEWRRSRGRKTWVIYAFHHCSMESANAYVGKWRQRCVILISTSGVLRYARLASSVLSILFRRGKRPMEIFISITSIILTVCSLTIWNTRRVERNVLVCCHSGSKSRIHRVCYGTLLTNFQIMLRIKLTKWYLIVIYYTEVLPRSIQTNYGPFFQYYQNQIHKTRFEDNVFYE